ncbi:myristoyl transferase [Komagataeibacter rhaeticus]|uniref:ABC transporter substrate-binding protein n=1 Tax=Komagataeibacter rhaeticus TaxID=215221 RepID=UPI000691EB93|nr:ABC transporter substrate-binding protein [Komagataeibacter rhaeticus]MBL7238704.1 ABC transporter substrate-binding protein [Komagataeibacter rhaeticus]PYD53012.1 myristoyl transferase [Komagataeibacter rhaeticus]GBQ09182.1 NMT1/THI5-like domain-containing protein [Komagataeibacter rhaeticus DSM 16663]
MPPLSRLLHYLTAVFLPFATVAPACAASPRHVTIAVGTAVLNADYPMLTLPQSLGYWKSAGYDVQVEPVGASQQALQQMVSGNAQFAQVNASVIVQADTTHGLGVRVAMENAATDWSIAVPADSPIRTATDLKGKTIGVFSLATGGILLLNSYLRQNGLNPATDVSLIPLGLGAPPVQALGHGQVDALLYWAAPMAQFDNVGLKLRHITPPDWPTYPDFSLSVMKDTVAADPDMVVAIARGMAMATVFAEANPTCALRWFWHDHPEARGTNLDDETQLRWGLHSLTAELASQHNAFVLNGGQNWGEAQPAGFERLQTLLHDAGLIPGTIPATDYMVRIPDYMRRVNDFDAAAIREQAARCTIP